ncbi:MAG: hypothetical protein EON54_03225 [Alcaligenaceae bacterium]|nr:MAG: hypothetical protein EON54_03225 [Alcaligenaceae bacterium]
MSDLSPSIAPDIIPADNDHAVLEIVGHLGAALIQAAPSDDPIIIEHIRAAHGLALNLYRQSGRR